MEKIKEAPGFRAKERSVAPAIPFNVGKACNHMAQRMRWRLETPF
jgi:hypothetical protein